MTASFERTWQELTEATAELADALQVVHLLAAGFDRALFDTRWQAEAAGLLRAAERADDAMVRLRRALAQGRPPP